jgi:hypothetical protein
VATDDDRDFSDMDEAAKRIRVGRAATLGPVEPGFVDLGKVWGAQLRAAFGMPDLPDVPPDVVCQMFVGLKSLRACRGDRGFCEDDFVDEENYLGFSFNIARRNRRTKTEEASADRGGQVTTQERQPGPAVGGGSYFSPACRYCPAEDDCASRTLDINGVRKPCDCG